MPPKILQSHQTTRKMSDWELACLARFNKREEEYQEAALLNMLGRNLGTHALGNAGGRCGNDCHPLTLYCTQRCAEEHWCEHKKVCKESPEKDAPTHRGLSGGRCANCGDEFTFLHKLQGPPRVALIMATERQLFNSTPAGYYGCGVPRTYPGPNEIKAHECFVTDKILARAIKIQSIIRMFLQRKDYLEILSLKPGGVGYLDVKKEFNSLVNATRKVPAAVVPKEVAAPWATALPWALLLAWYAVPAASKLITEFFDLWPR